jgi:hypothetical protein
VLLAGLVLGLAYMIILNTAGAIFPPSGDGADYSRSYIKMMWRKGPVALGFSSALFLALIKWAVGLSRVSASAMTGSSGLEIHRSLDSILDRPARLISSPSN